MPIAFKISLKGCASAKGGDQLLGAEEDEDVGAWPGEGMVVAYSLPSMMETCHAQWQPTQKPQLPRLRAASVSLLKQPAHGQVLARMYFTADSRSNISSMIATGGGLSASSPLRAPQGPPKARLIRAETIVAAGGLGPTERRNAREPLLGVVACPEY